MRAMHAHFAYIDPGAGSLLIQAIVAGIVSVPFLLRTQLRGFVSRFRRQSPEHHDVQPGRD